MYKMKMEKRNWPCNVSVSMYGDGAANQGQIWEVANMAKLWNIPAIFVCENNQYAMTVSLEKSTAVKQYSVRGAAYGFEGKTIDEKNIRHLSVGQCVDFIRNLNRPIHISFDVDAMDPELISSTGTRVPDGLMADEVEVIINGASLFVKN
jgi:TPP-dependent pyruvate/acetoin dehydrogenase alpha subunit